MNDYSFTADLLNKFSQLTPWVQVSLGFFICAMIAAWGFFVKEIIRVIAEQFGKPHAPQPRVIALEARENYTGPPPGW